MMITSSIYTNKKCEQRFTHKFKNGNISRGERERERESSNFVATLHSQNKSHPI